MNRSVILPPVAGALTSIGLAYVLGTKLDEHFRLGKYFMEDLMDEEKGPKLVKEIEDPRRNFKRTVSIILAGTGLVLLTGYIGDAVEMKLRSDLEDIERQESQIEEV